MFTMEDLEKLSGNKNEMADSIPTFYPTIEPFSLRSDLLGAQPHSPVSHDQGVKKGFQVGLRRGCGWRECPLCKAQVVLKSQLCMRLNAP